MGISETAADGPHTISRRGFLAGAATVAAVAVLPVATAAHAGAATLAKAPATLTRSTFTPLLQSSFKMLNAAGRSVTVVLSEIDDLSAASAGSETRFSLMFDGPTKSALPSAVYSLRSSGLATFSLFLVPVDRGVVARHYQAVIYTK
jgi:hypothetical protein